MLQTSILRTARLVKEFLVTYRFQIWDFAVMAVATAAALFLAAEYQLLLLLGVPAQNAKSIELAELMIVAIALGVSLFVAVRRGRMQAREVARRTDAEALARQLALNDPLTGLPNRRQFDATVAAAIAAPPSAGMSHAVLLMDLNGFKSINDTYGHPAGDAVLQQLGTRLSAAVRETNDHVARLGGDEFGVVATHVRSAEDANTIALRILSALDEPVVCEFGEFRLGAGIGIALFPHDGDTASELVRRADVALYRAKAQPGFAISFFEEQMDTQLRERAAIETELRLAIEAEQIRPHYQPIVTLSSNKILGFEALARWTHRSLGEIPPDRFIPLAESCGLMRVLGDQLLRAACLDASAWPADTVLSFNVSPAQLRDPTYGVRVLAILAETSLPASRLELEITENAMVSDLELATNSLGVLREAGVRIALDDFGTGYSSLYHLRNFKFDRIKIDRSFVGNMAQESESAAIVKALLGLAHGLGVPVTAEGIESSAQLDSLELQGCDQGQGFFLGEAMTAAGALALLADADPSRWVDKSIRRLA